ncbi:MAG: NADP-dependent isocitrate dehydrogenase [Opitutales bacterium]
MSDAAKIIYTITDEAPALATWSLLPIIEAFTKAADVAVETRDISLSGRILAQFPDYLREDQRIPDDLAELGQWAKTPEANIIKLPNISASLPQLKAAIKELQEQGHALPDYPEAPETEKDIDVRTRYERVKGSAVNPVLREGNSDRRVAPSVKEYARRHPHSMGEWSPESKSHVASMREGDFYGSEQSRIVASSGKLRMEFEKKTNGETTVLKGDPAVESGEVVDAAVFRVRAFRAFLKQEMEAAREAGVLFSIHLKATMMKVSDPILFGHAVSVYFEEVYGKHAATLKKLGVSPNNGLGELVDSLNALPEEERKAIEADIEAAYERGPDLAMVDSHRGITNLHVPSDVIIDASMPAAIRSSGKMWNKSDELQDMKAVIPDRSYAGVYQTVIDFCKKHGAFDPATMGSVANVGLMARKAEEYGSHDKTFEIPEEGTVRVVDAGGNVLLEHDVGAGDIWRMCQTKDVAIRDWVKLAVNRARAAGVPAIFWLDPERAHDARLMEKVEHYLKEHDTAGLDIRILSPGEAMEVTLQRTKDGEDTISVTGNVLRDYLTDLFPILELGTSAKMLSIVPLINGGGLFETGAGGSAPKHVRQLLKENHLRWDSLGEFLALGVSLEHLGQVFNNAQARMLAKSLDVACGNFLEANKNPSRKAGELDNRGSHFYFALYWARALAAQEEDPDLKECFIALERRLSDHEDKIVEELNDVQGKPVDLGGYFRPDAERAISVMRPSKTFNEDLASLYPKKVSTTTDAH